MSRLNSLKRGVCKIEQQTQRLNLLKQKVRFQDKVKSFKERKARTRTLIQLGGLLEKAGYPALFGIKLGEDLQIDRAAFLKACALYGALNSHQGTVSESLKKNVGKWQKMGLRDLEKLLL